MLNDEQLERLRNIFTQVSGGGHRMLSEWEVSFIHNLEGQFDEYEERCRISEKQWAVIERIEEKL